TPAPGKGYAPGDDLLGGELHRIERRVQRGVGLTDGRSRRDRLHQMPLAHEKARETRTLPASSRGLPPNGSVGLVDDDLAVRHLRPSLEDPLELLVAHPLGCDTSRLVGLRRGVEEADRAHDALTGVDQEVAAEAGQLAQARRQTLADLLRQLVLVAPAETLAAAASLANDVLSR